MANLAELLKTKKLRLTKARKMVFQILKNSNKALSPKDIHSKLNEASLNADLVSVYRNLTVFSELGLAHRMQDGRYSFCKHEHNDTKHIHLIMSCTDCGRVEEVESHSHGVCKMAKDLKSIANHLENVGSITLQGQCTDCIH